jgi:hypothetical protein
MSFVENKTHRRIDLETTTLERVPHLSVIVTDATGLLGTADIYVSKPPGSAQIGERFLIHTWIADADMSEPDAQTDYSVASGEQMYQHEANADYTVISEASGNTQMDIEVAAEKTVYVMAEIDGRIYSGSAAITD